MSFLEERHMKPRMNSILEQDDSLVASMKIKDSRWSRKTIEESIDFQADFKNIWI